MNRYANIRHSLMAVFILTAGFFTMAGCNFRSDDAGPQSRLVLAAGGLNYSQSMSGYTRAYPPASIEFPADFGPHPDFQTEWWYYTGNLETSDGRHFGYQLTFFRRALLPPDERPPRDSQWSAAQVYMAHFAVTDTAAQQHHAYERLARGSAGIAGAQAEPYQVWLQDWQVEEFEAGKYHLSATQVDLALDLTLNDLKGPILNGEQGYSQKGPDPGNASYYYSQTRLQTEGNITVNGSVFPVSGLSWKDHEYSTSALSEDQVGWDWFSIQLDDLSEIMVYHFRRADGTVDPYSSGTLIAPDGSTQALAWDDFKIEVLDTWKSPQTGAFYPNHWLLKVPAAGIDLEIKPRLPDQEMNLSYAYWEGAVSVSGQKNGRPVRGAGYVELSGYAGSLSGEF